MTRILLPAMLLLAPACASTHSSSASEAQGPGAPIVEQSSQLYRVADEKTRDRVGYVEKVTYDRRLPIFWVYGPDREDKLGYVLSSGRAFKYIWIAGQKSSQPEDLGSDTVAVGVRKILDLGASVVLIPITEQEYANEIRAKMGLETKPQKTSPPPKSK